MPSRVALGAAAALVLVASLVALAWRPATGAGHAATDVAADYRAEQRSLAAQGLLLAPGRHWPARLSFPSTAPDGSKIGYGTGFGATQADEYWFCSWAARAVAGEPAGELAAVARTHFFRESLAPEDRASFAAMVAGAAQGHVGTLRDFVSANCSGR